MTHIVHVSCPSFLVVRCINTTITITITMRWSLTEESLEATRRIRQLKGQGLEIGAHTLSSAWVTSASQQTVRRLQTVSTGDIQPLETNFSNRGRIIYYYYFFKYILHAVFVPILRLFWLLFGQETLQLGFKFNLNNQIQSKTINQFALLELSSGRQWVPRSMWSVFRRFRRITLVPQAML